MAKPLSDFELTKRAQLLGLPPQEFAVLAAILHFGRHSWPSIKMLCHLVNRSPQRVRESLKGLRERGLISWELRRNATNIFHVNSKAIVSQSRKRAEELEALKAEDLRAGRNKHWPKPQKGLPRAEFRTPPPAEFGATENGTQTDHYINIPSNSNKAGTREDTTNMPAERETLTSFSRIQDESMLAEVPEDSDDTILS